jgi:hypothetical protein
MRALMVSDRGELLLPFLFAPRAIRFAEELLLSPI